MSDHNCYIFSKHIFFKVDCLPGGGDKGLDCHEEEEKNKGADQVGLKCFIPHLRELEHKTL